MPAEPERIEAFFNTPTVEEMRQLAPKVFERFDTYVADVADVMRKALALNDGIDQQGRMA